MLNIFVSRSVLIASIVGAALAAGGFFIAPNHDEQRAMHHRELYERAQLLYVSGDRQSGIDILKRAVSGGDVNADMIRTLLGYYAAAGRAQEHFALLRSDAADLLNPVDLRAAISLYETNDMNDAALSIRRTLARRGVATPSERSVLALHEASSGRVQVAVNMADQIGRGLAVGADANTGAAVVKVLTMAERRDLAAAFLARWLNGDTPASTAVDVAPVLIENGYSEYAVAALRNHQRSSPQAREIYVHALRDASSRSPALRAELTRDILNELPHLPPGDTFNVALHDLFAFGDIDMVITDMSGTGAWRNQAIRPAFVYSLRTHGRTAALATLLSSEARAGDVGVEQARAAARELAEIGSGQQAAAALMTIAEREGPTGGALSDLFYVWSSNRQQADTAWFAARIRASTGETVDQWVAAVARNISGPAAVAAIDAVAGHPDTEARARLAVLKARYLGWQGDSPALRRAITAAGQLQLSANDAGEMARLACLIGDADAAFRLTPRASGSRYTEELAQCANRFSLLSARNALAAGRSSEALDRYAAVATAGEAMSAQDYFDYAEATRRSARAAAAPALFQTALEKLPDPNRDTVDTGLLRAAILTRLARYDEARASYETIFREHPRSNRARVALIEFLLDRGAYEDALQLTNKPASSAADSEETAS